MALFSIPCRWVLRGMLQTVVGQVKLRHSFNALAENVEAEVFVGGVDGITFQTKAHEDGFGAQQSLKVADDRDTTTTTNGQWTTAKGFLKPLFGSLVGRQTDGANIALATMHGAYRYFYAGRSDLSDIVGARFWNLHRYILPRCRRCRNWVGRRCVQWWSTPVRHEVLSHRWLPYTFLR